MPFFSWEFAPWPISQQEALGCQGGETELSAQALPAEHYQPLRQTSSGRLPRRSLRPLSFDYVGEDLVAQGPSDLIRTHKKTPTEDSEAGVDHPDTSEISHLLRNNRCPFLRCEHRDCLPQWRCISIIPVFIFLLNTFPCSGHFLVGLAFNEYRLIDMIWRVYRTLLCINPEGIIELEENRSRRCWWSKLS